ncbi:MAG: cell wall-binding repeat-containing protein [Mobiluncus porci]|uniref:cell wall-binding repeat-containing protein n=1 Tax=Mobiluncus porci TaxID=2652278 RepID=UPI0023F168C1|nr:cell wall-binding repeat-containing protein [Mobiluncus porci]MDD7541958.1 cell wall-binding repeat-containing protein [Mobiluncus porci]MDY5748891.1 cell wall-binding repeat-containing protein [Mobiluncus porci]
MRKSFLTLGAAIAALSLVAPATAMAADADRYAGPNRFETAIAVASAFGTADVVYLARGDQQVDAVSGGRLQTGPVLLVNEDAAVQALVKSKIADLKATKVVVLGGEGAVSEAAAKAVAGDATISRLAGANRFGTAVAISKSLHPSDGDGTEVYLANGLTLVDALVGGQIKGNAPILLTNGSGALPKETADEIKRLAPAKVTALGGEGAVLPSELTEAAKLGKTPTANAETKARADLVKASREAHMAVEGWYTIADGKTLNDFMDTTNGCAKADANKDNLATTFPKVLDTDIKTDCAANIFAVDGATTAGNKAAADAKAGDTTDAKTYKGLQAIDKAIQADTGATNTAKGQSADALIAANKAITDADAAVAAGPTKEQIAKYETGAAENRIAGNNRFETAAAIAAVAYPNGTGAAMVYAANGSAFADASVAGYLDNKAELAGPVVLVALDTIPATTDAYVKAAKAGNSALAGKFKALGGNGVIADSVVTGMLDLLK